jgi:hypothetical protein
MRDGQAMDSGNGPTMRILGDLTAVLYASDKSTANWATNPTQTNGGWGSSCLVMQDDGNLCFYRGTGPSDNHGVLWASNTGGRPRGPYVCTIQPEGSLQIYHGTDYNSRHDPIWCNTGTCYSGAVPQILIQYLIGGQFSTTPIWVRPEQNTHDAKIVATNGVKGVAEPVASWVLIPTRVTTVTGHGGNNTGKGSISDAVMIQNAAPGWNNRLIAVKNAQYSDGNRCVFTEFHFTPNEFWVKVDKGTSEGPEGSLNPNNANLPHSWMFRSVQNPDYVMQMDSNLRDVTIVNSNDSNGIPTIFQIWSTETPPTQQAGPYIYT